jgi:hypothetical protein
MRLKTNLSTELSDALASLHVSSATAILKEVNKILSKTLPPLLFKAHFSLCFYLLDSPSCFTDTFIRQ